jgi:hypothetical protein
VTFSVNLRHLLDDFGQPVSGDDQQPEKYFPARRLALIRVDSHSRYFAARLLVC